MSPRQDLWEATFILKGIRLPDDEVTVDNLDFERLREEEAKGVSLPARCHVRVRASSNNVGRRAMRIDRSTISKEE